MSAEDQVNGLAAYIMAEIPGEPSKSEGAGETAVRLLTGYREAMQAALNELGVPDESYPAPVANAVDLLNGALGEGTMVDA